jgi:hypothetical protein
MSVVCYNSWSPLLQMLAADATMASRRCYIVGYRRLFGCKCQRQVLQMSATVAKNARRLCYKSRPNDHLCSNHGGELRPTEMMLQTMMTFCYQPEVLLLWAGRGAGDTSFSARPG